MGIIASMTAFADTTLVALGDHATLVGLLDPPSDASHERIRALLSAMYDLSFTRIHDVLEVKVRRCEVARPVFPALEYRGALARTTPDYVRTDVRLDRVDRSGPVWVDLAAELRVTLIVEFDDGAIDAILTTGIETFATLEEFRNSFTFLDLDDFMARHGLTTVDDLRGAFDYVKVEVHGRTQSPFDEDDPSNRVVFGLNVALLLRDVIDLGEAMRAAKLARAVLDRSVAAPSRDDADAHRSFVPVLVFPATAVGATSFTEADIEGFFRGEGVIAVFRS